MKLSNLIALMQEHNLQFSVINPSNTDIDLKYISADSRKVIPGSLYVAYNGESVDSRNYILDVINKNVAVIMCEAASDNLSDVTILTKEVLITANKKSVVLINVIDLKKHLGMLFSGFFGDPSKDQCIYAITGTNGKTTCSYLLAQLLFLLNPSKDAGIIGTIGRGNISSLLSGQQFNKLNNTTPGPLELNEILADFKANNVKNICMEASSHALEQGRLNSVNIDTAIYTNLSHDHLDYHRTMTEYFNAKLKLFKFNSLNNIIINADDQYGVELLKDLKSNPEYIKNKHLMIYGCNKIKLDEYKLPYICYEDDKIIIRLFHDKDIEVFSIKTRLIGKFNKYNVMAIIAAAIASGSLAANVVKQCEKLLPAPGRMEVYSHKTKNIDLIVDYAHTPDALEKALLALNQERIESNNNYNIWCVFGCGGDRDKSKRSIMGQVSSIYSDNIILTNDNPRTEDPDDIIDDIKQGISNDSYKKVFAVIKDRRLAIKKALENAVSGDRILIAGKGHEDYQIIGNDKIDYNERGFVEGLVKND